MYVKMEEGSAVNHAVERSGPSCVKFTKCLQQAFDPKIAISFGSRPNFGRPVYQINIVGLVKIHLCLSHFGQVLRLSGAVAPEVLLNTFLRITRTVPEVLSTENQITFNLSFLPDPGGIMYTVSEEYIFLKRIIMTESSMI